MLTAVLIAPPIAPSNILDSARTSSSSSSSLSLWIDIHSNSTTTNYQFSAFCRRKANYWDVQPSKDVSFSFNRSFDVAAVRVIDYCVVVIIIIIIISGTFYSLALP